jgi:hypothetical protein
MKEPLLKMGRTNTTYQKGLSNSLQYRSIFKGPVRPDKISLRVVPMDKLRTLKSFLIFKIKIKKSKTYIAVDVLFKAYPVSNGTTLMHADLIRPESIFKYWYRNLYKEKHIATLKKSGFFNNFSDL